MNHQAPTVAGRLAQVRDEIAAAAARAGRDDAAVVLVGASKQQPLERLLEAYAAGLRVFGENRVQEAAAKRPQLPADVAWHLLGPLQTNKVAAAVSLFQVLHAVDRARVAQALSRSLAPVGGSLDVFLEVNLGDEPSKHGFAADALLAAASALAALPGLRVVGLMAIPPPEELPARARAWFRQLRELRDRLAAAPGWSSFPGWLSMGMSEDYALAVEEGATHVRVGSALFGARPAAG